MKTEINNERTYLPHFFDTDDRRWDILEMDWVIDSGGRRCEMKCQYINPDTPTKTKAFRIYGLTEQFIENDGEEVFSCTPVKGKFYNAVMDLFYVFDTTGKVAKSTVDIKE